MTTEDYESRTDSVLAWQKAQKLGRFADDADAQLDAQVAAFAASITKNEITVGARCRILPVESDARRGEVAFVGPIPELPDPRPEEAVWVGVRLDEPVGKNDGSVKGTRYFDAQGRNRGVFVRGERLEVGDFGAEDDDLFDEDMEEI